MSIDINEYNFKSLKNNHERQLLLKRIVNLKTPNNSDFSFKFTAGAETLQSLFLDSVSQNIEYGWEAPSDSAKSVHDKSVTKVRFTSAKTDHSIDLEGSVYINLQIGVGLDNFSKFKNYCNQECYWILVDANGKNLKGSGKGYWYVKSIKADIK